MHELPECYGAVAIERAIDETTSHSTRLSKNDNQVAGYHESPMPCPYMYRSCPCFLYSAAMMPDSSRPNTVMMR